MTRICYNISTRYSKMLSEESDCERLTTMIPSVQSGATVYKNVTTVRNCPENFVLWVCGQFIKLKLCFINFHSGFIYESHSPRSLTFSISSATDILGTVLQTNSGFSNSVVLCKFLQVRAKQLFQLKCHSQ